jgi:hypothetical protein
MGQRIWDKFLTERDKAVFAAGGFGARAGFGDRPALLVVDVNWAFCGERREPILESIKRWRTSCGEESWVALEYIKQLIEAARAKGLPVIYTTGERRPDNWDAGSWRWKSTRGDRSSSSSSDPRQPTFMAHRAARHRPKPRSGPRCHDTDHHLIAAPACRRTLLPPLHRCGLDASEGTCDAVGHAKIITSTAAATTNSRLGSSIRRHRLWPAYPLPKPPPRQIPIDRRLSTQPPRVPSWEAFGRRPSERVDRSRRAGIRNPSPP